MMPATSRILRFSIILLLTTLLTGCINNVPYPSSISDHYEYTVKEGYYAQPSFTNKESRGQALLTDTEDGQFFCMTVDTNSADEFVNAQRTLLLFLQEHGVNTEKLTYYATDYDDSFSDSKSGRAYITLSAVKSYQQVLITLQTLWGDFIDYGYIYALSNAIADHLGWQVDAVKTLEDSYLNDFFKHNPNAITLLYPCFTTEYTSNEMVGNCKTLSRKLLTNFNWISSIGHPIEEQLHDYKLLIADYAAKIGVPYSPQTCGYAYYGKNIPLRILTSYAELVVDRNYSDFYSDDLEEYDGYFSGYESIYQTANLIDTEISTAIKQFHLEEKAGVIAINWLSKESAKALHGKELVNHYNSYLQEVVVTTINGYLHEYYHHIEHLLNDELGQCWQSQAFCEIGRSNSYYSLISMESPFTNIKQWADVFYSFTGRAYQPGVDDYFEAYDILCYITNEYVIDYYNGRNALNSFVHYLIDNYGEDITCNLLLFPDSAEELTQKTWEELEVAWKSNLESKYKGCQIPDWVNRAANVQ